MFPLRLCGGKLLVAVTRERRYGPSRLRVSDDDDDGGVKCPVTTLAGLVRRPTERTDGRVGGRDGAPRSRAGTRRTDTGRR